ncbi:hypothetical protein F938_03957 [Acinetobacter bereziniae LMG 1003 = CIP 70.12]|uniref:Uncharacterized protein n=2 Tax=Acinetobacter bereziniae TaxID=106648 RepID=N9CXM0_ACIBZ|nr:hypothetical protein [Acinetobacter bereziniae]ENV90361.1 hypothetical protein F938_03957 [Acinetobacter bereziniae LMG 1003 = CIP 70.12]
MADIGLILAISRFNFSYIELKTNNLSLYYGLDQTRIEGEIMKSKIGLSFCIIYLLLSAFCLYIALDPMTDNKGNFVFLQLPIGFQVSAFNVIGLGPLLDRLSWMEAYSLVVPVTLLFLYGIGWLLSLSIHFIKARIGPL